MQDLLNEQADPLRRLALHILWDDGEHCVAELMARLDATQSRMSRHMKILRAAGLVLARQDAQWVRYRRNTTLAPDPAAVVEAVLRGERSNRTASHDHRNTPV